MFADLGSWSQRAWMLGLLIAWAALLFGGFVLGNKKAGVVRRIPRWTRLLSSVALTIAAASWAWLARGTAAASFARLIALGMTLGLVGDLLMGGLLPGLPRVPGGLAAFGLGHVAYILAGLVIANRLGLTAGGTRSGAWAAWLTLGAVGWYLIVLRQTRQPSPLHWFALPYALLLASTAGIATGLALQNTAFAPFAVGAALFLLSDLLIAAGLFAQRNIPLLDDLVWLTYGPGQMLIVYDIGVALRLARDLPALG